MDRKLFSTHSSSCLLEGPTKPISEKDACFVVGEEAKKSSQVYSLILRVSLVYSSNGESSHLMVNSFIRLPQTCAFC